MNGLKRSLEDAIKEMQEIPAGAPSSSAQDEEDLRLARAADTLQVLRGMPVSELAETGLPEERLSGERPVETGYAETGFAEAGYAETGLTGARLTETGLVSEPMPMAPAVSADTRMADPEFVPAANSIEAALSSAPAVSPHYIPPKPIAPVARASRMPGDHDPSAKASPVKEALKQATPFLEPAPSAPLFGQQEQAAPKPPKPVGEINAAMPPPRSREQKRSLEPARVAADIPDVEEFSDTEIEESDKARPQRDSFWRWTTIGISCVGGLASGWLGSNLSDRDGGMFSSNVQTIVGKASGAAGSNPPAAIGIMRGGGTATTSGAGLLGASGAITGKTDRAVPLDDDLCTVLELDRGTGLTLAKPCKEIKSTGFNSTLGKSDLLAKPK